MRCHGILHFRHYPGHCHLRRGFFRPLPLSLFIFLQVTNVVTNPQHDHLPLDEASRLCNSDLLSRTEQLICFAFHDSNTIIETTKEARSLNMIVTELYLD